MTLEQCSDLEALAKSLGVEFSAVETSDGFLVFLGEEDCGFDRYSDGVIHLIGVHPVEPEWLSSGNRFRDLEKAACYFELGLLEEAWQSIEELPWRRLEDADVWMLRLEILAKQGKWDVIYAMALEAAESEETAGGGIASVAAAVR